MEIGPAKLETLCVPEGVSQPHCATVLLFLKCWTRGAIFRLKLRQNGFILEKSIHQYVFLRGYKKYFKMKQNKVVKKKNLVMYFFSLDNEVLIQVLGNDYFVFWSRWPIFFLCWRALKLEVICISPGSVHFGKKENYMPEEYGWPIYRCLCLC